MLSKRKRLEFIKAIGIYSASVLVSDPDGGIKPGVPFEQLALFVE